ncbi:MAG: AtpZ/AtpI family protein [Phaeodactylibacter sp.]|nr:AtpZ/AtpI family protein [Phaeodactylibacter sp.]
MQKKTPRLSKKQKRQAHNNEDENKGPQEGRPREKFDAYLKYSGMAFQMGIIILVGTYAGKMLDSHFQTERPYLTVLLALLSIFAALYVSLKDLFTGNK